MKKYSRSSYRLIFHLWTLLDEQHGIINTVVSPVRSKKAKQGTVMLFLFCIKKLLTEGQYRKALMWAINRRRERIAFTLSNIFK